MEKRESNYEIMRKQMQAHFASYDLEAIRKRWEMDQVEGYMLVDFVGRSYRIDMENGAVLYEEDGEEREADYNVCMTLYDILTRERQRSSGSFRLSGSFSTVHLSSSGNSSGGFFKQAAEIFDHHDEELKKACETLGGRPYGKGDVAYRIPLFQDLDMLFQFWDSDEDFQAEVKLFCDENILNFMHFETMMFMLSHVMERLTLLVTDQF